MRSPLLYARILLCVVAAVTVRLPACAQVPTAQALTLGGDVTGAHDPSMIHAGDTWFVFTTGKAPGGGQLGVRCSRDLHAWRDCGYVFDSVPKWIQQRSPETKDLWAPDISFEHGRFRLYYSYSAFGKNTSGIALATNSTLDPSNAAFSWKDEGPVLESTANDDFNAIDPNYFEDSHHCAWLAFGSFWTGIKMRSLDASTGKLSSSDTKLYSLATRGANQPAEPHAPGLPPDTQAVEAPFLVNHDGYYYLFTSFDLCCRGTRSTYRTMVGRSRSVTGPYVDRAGKPLLHGGGSQVLTANERWVGPGGASIVVGRSGAPDLLVYHAYDSATGKPSLQISTIVWQNGWPQAALAR